MVQHGANPTHPIYGLWTYVKMAQEQGVEVPKIHLLIGNCLTRFKGTAAAFKAMSDALFKNVVAPDINTVYLQVFLDLREGALLLEKPELDRYVSITFLDAYTNCENYIGTEADGNQAKKWSGCESDQYVHIWCSKNVRKRNGFRTGCQPETRNLTSCCVFI